MRHNPESDATIEARDQHQFDEAVSRDGKRILEIVAALAIVAAVAMSAIALTRSTGTVRVAAAAPSAATHLAAASSAVPAVIPVDNVKIIPTYKVGPDGKKHDAFTRTDFSVKVGQPLKLVIDNADDVNHSITSPSAGVNIVVTPGVHTYTLVVKTAGHFSWFCMVPCDSDANGWAMRHPGFMSGFITAS